MGLGWQMLPGFGRDGDYAEEKKKRFLCLCCLFLVQNRPQRCIFCLEQWKKEKKGQTVLFKDFK